MKICIITCHNSDNHGARLQAYALVKHLRDLGNEVEIIDYRPPYMNPTYRVFYWPGSSIRGWGRFFYYLVHRIRMKRRHRVFVSFSNQFLPLTERVYHGIDDLRRYPPVADLYLAGSDQIWNTTFPNGTDPAFYLDFGPDDVRRESYAASFATEEILPSAIPFVKENLKRFDKITVRENSGLQILKKLGFHGEQKDDPVFLLSKNEWGALCDDTGQGKRYVLVYDFFSDSRIKKKAKEVARHKKLQIFAVCPHYQWYADKNYVTAGPCTFLALIKNAACLITNSFHGIAFSMIFGTPFVFVERPDGLNARMNDLIESRSCAALTRDQLDHSPSA